MGFPGATPAIDEADYAGAHPYYAELCALSELRKKPGFGPRLQSGIGGHCLLYLHGVRLDRAAAYPVVALGPPAAARAGQGVGISVNSHYKNANWVGFEGAGFLWHGTLGPGERLTRREYARTQEAAIASGMLQGVEFHDHLLRDRPRDQPVLEYMYELSAATDYAVCFGRDTYRARIPLDAGRMGAIVDYLNMLNAPYRAGQRSYRWRLFNDNCVHVAHNALAAAGVWPAWPTGKLAALAMFRFPVPKNAFVDLLRRSNDLPLADAAALFRDRALRETFLNSGILPVAPGGLAIAAPAIRDNEIYDTAKLRLIFYDDPIFGPYRRRFARIFSEPRYFDRAANLHHFESLCRLAISKPVAGGPGEAGLSAQYRRHIVAMAETIRQRLAGIPALTRAA